uniref:Uncharacterized protein n=1 Tax=viral metagenome TaxID=1070528 RepID=A0A6M3LKQ2_9ZZZZ
MTRVFGQTVTCPKCHHIHTAETQFSRDVRNEQSLDSNFGYGVADIDCDSQRIIIHKFKCGGSREIQAMMDIEVKTRGADLSESERDTLHMRNQVIRNRRQTPTKEKRFESGRAPLKVFSLKNKKNVFLRHFGVHVLRFSHTSWTDSEWIEWDKQRIGSTALLSLLRFEIDADTMQRMDGRPHHLSKDRSQEFPEFKKI